MAQILGLSFFFTGTFTILTVAASYMFLFSKAQVEGPITAAVTSGAEKALHASTLPPGFLANIIKLQFLGNIDYAPGFTLFQLAWHVLLPGSIAAMILGPASAHWARRRPARIPVIVGMAFIVATFVGLTFDHSGWVAYVIFFVQHDADVFAPV